MAKSIRKQIRKYYLAKLIIPAPLHPVVRNDPHTIHGKFRLCITLSIPDDLYVFHVIRNQRFNDRRAAPMPYLDHVIL